MANVKVTKLNKEEYIDFFHQYTNNIFKDKLPDDFETIILKLVDGKTNKNDVNRENKLVMELINPIYHKYSKGETKLISRKLPKKYYTAGSQMSELYSTVAHKIKLPTKKKAVYITDLLPGSNKIMGYINADDYGEDFKADYDYIVSILDVLKENLDNEFEDYKKELKSDYSIIIIDVTESDLTIKLVRATDLSKGCIYFLKARFQAETGQPETKFLPIKGYNPHLPEEQEPFIHSLEDTLDIFPEYKEELSVKSKVDEKAQVKAKPPLVKESELSVNKSVSEKLIRKTPVKLSYNPYDNNQYLRVLTLEGLETKYLQGRSKYDEKDDKFNLYEDSEENKLVGVMSFPQGEDSKAVINWCTNYSPK